MMPNILRKSVYTFQSGHNIERPAWNLVPVTLYKAIL